MYILNYVLLAAGILFALAMFFICFGLFHTPRPKPARAEIELELKPSVSPSGRHIIDVSDDEDNVNDEASEADTAAEEYDEEPNNARDNNTVIDAEDTDNAAKENISAEKKPVSANHNPKNLSQDIEICVTIIDTNKKKTIAVKDEILIGRNPKCDVVINKPMVSAAHCILMREGSKLMVEDNNSTNGTLLNGKPLNHLVELKNNDVLTLGDKSVRINFL